MSAAPFVVAGASWAEPSGAFARAFSALADGAVRPVGVRGATLRRWLPVALDHAEGATVVVLEMGGNGAPTASDVRAADDALRAAGARAVVWVRPPLPWPTTTDRARLVNERRKATAAALDLAGVTVLRHGFDARPHVSGDGVHLRAAGYAALAQAVFERMGRGSFAALLLGVAAVGGLAAAAASGGLR